MIRFLPLFAVAIAAMPAPAQILQVTSGTQSVALAGFAGQTFTTPSGGPWNNITFDFYATPAAGSAPASGPEAVGTAFLLTQVYSGTPANLSSSTPGYVASSVGTSGGIYMFPSGVVLYPNTPYWIYENGMLAAITLHIGAPVGNYEASSATGDFGQTPSLAGTFNFTLGGTLSTAPYISSVQNPASNILPLLPNYGIAQGAIMIVYGSGFGPTTLAEPSALPWPTSFAGTSVTVTQGGSVYNVPIIYVFNNQAGGYSQLAGVMPSNTAPGSAKVQLTYNGMVSPAFTTTIIANNFGISTINQTGTGTAVITYPTSTAPFYAVVSAANSAVPGNTYTMWGTGLGAATGGNTDTNVNVAGNVGPAVTVLVGGVSAAVTYYGRSPGAGPGLDQINFTIPTGLSGCAVSLVVQTNAALVSNSPSIPIAANGGLCSDPTGLPITNFSQLQALPGGVNFAEFGVNNTTSITLVSPYTIPPGTAETTSISGQEQAQFGNVTQSFLAGVNAAQISDMNVNVSLGSCVVNDICLGSSCNGSGGGGTSTALNAGTAITFAPPTGGSSVLASQGAGTGAFQASGTSLLPSGTYTASNGTGGTNIGPFTVNFTVPPFATWSNQNALNNATVTRANGLTITWSGGNSSDASYIDIQGGSSFNTAGLSFVGWECAAPIAAGTFTVPAYVLLALPAGIVNGSLQVSTSYSELVTVPGTNIAFAGGSNTVSVPINWK